MAGSYDPSVSGVTRSDQRNMCSTPGSREFFDRGCLDQCQSQYVARKFYMILSSILNQGFNGSLAIVPTGFQFLSQQFFNIFTRLLSSYKAAYIGLRSWLPPSALQIVLHTEHRRGNVIQPTSIFATTIFTERAGVMELTRSALHEYILDCPRFV